MRAFTAALLARAAFGAWSAACAWLGTPYDTSASLPHSLSEAEARPLDGIVLRTLGPAAHWDGAYFLYLADRGYTHEQFYAFFPFYPALIDAVRLVFATPLEAAGLLSARPALLLSGVALSCLAFAVAAELLAALTRRVFLGRVDGGAQLARVSSLLWCIGPATPFFGALYTESLFACLSFAGMLACEAAVDEATACTQDGKQPPARPWMSSAAPAPLSSLALLLAASACFTLAAATRSNGVLNAAYMLWAAYRLGCVALSRDAASREGARPAAQGLRGAGARLLRLAGLLAYAAAFALPVALPLPLFQWHGYFRFCAPPPPLAALAFGALPGASPLLSASGARKPLVLPGSALPALEYSFALTESHERKSKDELVGLVQRTLDARPPVLSWCITGAKGGDASHGSDPRSWHDAHPWPHRLDSPQSALQLLAALMHPPPLYAHVQRSYWGVGPFLYWQTKHAPQFLLAAPVALLCAAAVCAWVEAARARGAQTILAALFEPFSSLEFVQPHRLRAGSASVGKGAREAILPSSPAAAAAVAALPHGADVGLILSSPLLRALPFLGHWLFLVAFAVCAMHVQVATRLCAAACPALWWTMAALWRGGPEELPRTWDSSEAASECAAGEARAAPREPLSTGDTSGAGGSRVRVPAVGPAEDNGAGSTATPPALVRQRVRGGGSADAPPSDTARRGLDGPLQQQGLPALLSAAIGALLGPRPRHPAAAARFVLLTWCFTFALLGSALFTNFYPWT